MSNFFKHLHTVNKHRKLVRQQCFKCGFYKRGLLHDLSKYSPIEFKAGMEYYQGDSSPIGAEKEDKGYSLAWQHHKGHNPHHWEYWIDNIGTRKNTPIKIPYPYLIEMICDWIGAGKTYLGKNWSESEPYDYYMKVKDTRIINARSEKVIIYLLKTIKEEGMKVFYEKVKYPDTDIVLNNYITNID